MNDGVYQTNLSKNFDLDGNKERWTLEVFADPELPCQVVHLNRRQLQRLHKAIGEELGI
jgi:hypothetical protein